MDNRQETEEEMKERLRKEILEEMNNSKVETEEEKKDRMRKEILDELNNNSNIKNPANNSNIQSFGPPKKHSSVNFSSNKNVEEKESVETNNVEITDADKNGKTSPIVLVICLVIAIVTVISLPKIRKAFTKPKKIDSDVTEEEKKTEELEKLTLESESLENIKYPVLHVNSANKSTYLKQDKVSLSDLSNNDILYNGLIDVYEGNMANYKGSYAGTYCGNNNQKVSLDERYLELRIEGAFNKLVSYKHADITVPVNNPRTKYVGVWKYNSKTKNYIYYGNCNQKPSNVVYYDINVAYDVNNKLVDEKKKVIEVYLYNYIGFAEVDTTTKNYNIYSDASYTQKVASGTLKTNNYVNELQTIVGEIGKDKLNKYLYTFSNNNCPYLEYCFTNGQWVK